MTSATITLNVGTGGDKPLVDTLSTVDGAGAPTGASAQMVKIGHGAASDFKTASAATPLPIVRPDITAAGTLTAAGQLVNLALNGQSSAAIQITGTWVGVIQFEATTGGVTFDPINGVFSSSSLPATTATANGTYRITPGALASIQARMLSFTSGSATISIRASAGVGGVFANQVMPTRTQENGVISTTNSSAAALGVSGVFTGAWEDVTEYADIRVSVFSDQASATDGLQIQQSSNGTNADIPDLYSIPAAVGKVFSVGVSTKFYRVVYTNGATAQAAFRLQVKLHKSHSRPSSVRPQDARTNDNDMDEVLSHLMGYNGASWDRIRASIANGLAVDVTRAPASVVSTAAVSATTVLHNATAAVGLTVGANLSITGYGTSVIKVTGTFVGSFVFKVSQDAGVSWDNISGTQVGGGDIFTTATLPGSYRLTVAGFDLLRVEVTLTSGSITINGKSTNAVNASKVVKLATSGLVIGALVANQSVNKAQINGVAPLMGNGVSGTGTQRVNIASDNTAFAVNATLMAETTKVIGTVNVAASQAITANAGTNLNTSALALDATLTNHTQRLQAVTTLTTLSAANTAVTLTLPAVAAQFHYITRIRISMHNTSAAAVVGSAVTLAFTSSNVPGALAWTEGNALAAGISKLVCDEVLENPIKSSVVNTASTIVAPACGAGVLVRLTAYYYTAA